MVAILMMSHKLGAINLTRYGFKILHQYVKRLKQKVRKFLRANSYVYRSYRGKDC